MGHLYRIKILVIAFFMVSSLSVAEAKQKKKFPQLTKAQQRIVKKKVKSPSFGYFVLTRFKNNWSVLKLLQQHVPARDFDYLKMQADKLGVAFKQKMNIQQLGNGQLVINGEKLKHSQSGQELLYKNAVFKLDKKQSLEWNYKNITKQLSTIAALNSNCSLFMPCSFADDDGPSLGYNIMVALYYMKVWETGSAEVHWHGYLEEPEVQQALQNLGNRGVKISNVDCHDTGMTLNYDNDTYSDIIWNKESGENLRMSINDVKAPVIYGIGMGEYDHVRAADAWFYYCSMLDAEGQNKILDLLNKNILSPEHLEGDYSNGSSSH